MVIKRNKKYKIEPNAPTKYAELDNNDAIEEFDKVIINDPENMPGISVPGLELNKLIPSLVEQNQELLFQLRHTQKLLLQLQ